MNTARIVELYTNGACASAGRNIRALSKLELAQLLIGEAPYCAMSPKQLADFHSFVLRALAKEA